MGSSCVAQAGLELLGLSSPPTMASQSAGITGVNHRTQPEGDPISTGPGLSPISIFKFHFCWETFRNSQKKDQLLALCNVVNIGLL